MMNQGKNILIGIFVISALSILIFILLYLHPSAGDNGQMFHVRFDNIDKITIGTRVTLGGKPVGEVADIQEVPEAREEQAIHPGPIYIYELTLLIDSHVKLYKSDVFSMRTSGLLGERSIEITPYPPPKGKPLEPLKPTDIVYAESAGSVEETLKELGVLASKAEGTIDNINGILLEFSQRRIMENISTSVDNITEITTVLNQPQIWTDIVNNFHTFSKNLHTFGGDIYEIGAGIRRGEGTLGRIVINDEFYLNLSAIMSKATILMDDINHYGLLFHNNKSWQRVRARRMNLLERLCSPQEFANFFNDEIDEISTSLSRVSMVLNETERQCIPDEILCDKDFACVFADLLRRIKDLEYNINLYNQQVTEIREDACRPNCTLQGPISPIVVPTKEECTKEECGIPITQG